MAKVVIKKGDVDGFYAGTAGEFKINIQRTGNNVPRSIDLVLLGLGTCTISTVSHYMVRKGLPVENLAVELSAEYDEKEGHYKDFSIELQVDESIPAPMRKIISSIAKTCRIHKTLDARPQVSIEVTQAAGSSVSG
jgi:uncharacterized OsmC-like protein